MSMIKKRTDFPVDCVWSDWTQWNSCSETCGLGTKHRARSYFQEAMYGGNNCTGESTSTQTCNLSPCPGKERIQYVICWHVILCCIS